MIFDFRRRALTKWPSPVVEGLLQCTSGFPGFEDKKELSFVHNELTSYIDLSGMFHYKNRLVSKYYFTMRKYDKQILQLRFPPKKFLLAKALWESGKKVHPMIRSWEIFMWEITSSFIATLQASTFLLGQRFL